MAYPTDLARTKNWGNEVLTDADLEGQFDLIIAWVMAALNESTGHKHDATENEGPKILVSDLSLTSGAQGDVVYHNGTNLLRLAAGTAGQVLRTGGAAANPSWGDTPAAMSTFRNLKIVRTNVTTVTVTADELLLQDTNGQSYRISSVSEAIAITTSGASGLDTGAEANSTWYYIWIIRKSSDGTVNGLISTSASSPTLPSGYDQKALVGAVRNNGSGDFVDFVQEGNKYEYVAWQLIASGTQAAFASVDITAYVPASISAYASGYLTLGTGSGGTAIANKTGLTADTSVEANKMEVHSTNNSMHRWAMKAMTANTLYWYSDQATSKLYLDGFTIDKLF